MSLNETQLRKKTNETDFQYHKRIIDAKLSDKTLAEYDYSELSEYVYGKKYSSDVARRMMYGSKKTMDLLGDEISNEINEASIISELESKKIELQIEKQKFLDYRNEFNKAVREKSRREELNNIITNAINSSSLPTLNYSPCKIKESDNDIIVTINDIHYGANIHNAWTNYDSDVCRQMFCNYVDEIVKIAKTHKTENCIVVSAGDLINGNIHYSIAVSNKENVIEQVTGVSELIAEFLAELSNHFSNVRFISVSGNHSRINPNKDNSLVGERLDDLVEWYLQARLQNFKNVTIDTSHRIDPTISIFDVRGKTYCCTHGDFDGSDSKVKDLTSLIDKPLHAIIFGHKHHNAFNNIQGIKTVMGGSFIGMDDYCVQKRIFGKPQQMVCVCNDNGISCYYDIPLRTDE